MHIVAQDMHRNILHKHQQTSPHAPLRRTISIFVIYFTPARFLDPDCFTSQNKNKILKNTLFKYSKNVKFFWHLNKFCITWEKICTQTAPVTNIRYAPDLPQASITMSSIFQDGIFQLIYHWGLRCKESLFKRPFERKLSSNKPPKRER